MRDAFVRTLTGLARQDPRIMLLTGDLGFGVLTDFARQFPRQYLNVGVAEQNLTGLAAGLALEGRVVFTYSIANFPILRCLEQVRNDVCYHRANVKVVSIGGGFSYGGLGMSHHATEDLSMARALPNLEVVAPGDIEETVVLTRALAARPGPGYLRLDKSAAPPTPLDAAAFRFGQAREVRPGRAATIIATGGILGEALQAAGQLAARGLECRVLSLPVVKPLDGAAITRAVEETGGLVTLEEHNLSGGMGSAIAEYLLDHNLRPGFFLRLGLPDAFPKVVGSQTYLRQLYGLDANSIASALARRLPQTAASAP
jgi:transketolase